MEILDSNQPVIDPKSVSPYPVANRLGLIGGLCFVVYGFLMFIIYTNPTEGGLVKFLISTPIFVAIIIMAVRKHRDEDLGGYITFGRAFFVGFIAILIARTIFTLFNLLYTTVINPNFAADMLDQLREAYEKQGMSEAQIEQSIKFVEMFSNPAAALGFGIVWAAITGAVVAAIVAAFMQKERPASV